mgnify:CR=1 FL=1
MVMKEGRPGLTDLEVTEGFSRAEVLALLARPNPRQEGAAFLEAVCAHLMLAGNAYIEAVTLDGGVAEVNESGLTILAEKLG